MYSMYCTHWSWCRARCRLQCPSRLKIKKLMALKGHVFKKKYYALTLFYGGKAAVLQVQFSDWAEPQRSKGVLAKTP